MLLAFTCLPLHKKTFENVLKTLNHYKYCFPFLNSEDSFRGFGFPLKFYSLNPVEQTIVFDATFDAPKCETTCFVRVVVKLFCKH